MMQEVQTLVDSALESTTQPVDIRCARPGNFASKEEGSLQSGISLFARSLRSEPLHGGMNKFIM
jgi:hypothetical protein